MYASLTMHKKNLLKVIFFSILSFGIGMPCNAGQGMTQHDLDQAISLAGISYNQTGENLDITIEKNKALNAIPTLQQAGVVNPSLTQTDFNLLPVSLSASVVGMQFATWIINYIYKTNTTINNLHVQVFLSAPDDPTNNGKQLCYSFDFNRSAFDRIDWKNFTAINLPTASSNFTISDWCTRKETQELQFAGADKPQPGTSAAALEDNKK